MVYEKMITLKSAFVYNTVHIATKMSFYISFNKLCQVYIYWLSVSINDIVLGWENGMVFSEPNMELFSEGFESRYVAEECATSEAPESWRSAVVP